MLKIRQLLLAAILFVLLPTIQWFLCKGFLLALFWIIGLNVFLMVLCYVVLIFLSIIVALAFGWAATALINLVEVPSYISNLAGWMKLQAAIITFLLVGDLWHKLEMHSVGDIVVFVIGLICIANFAWRSIAMPASLERE